MKNNESYNPFLNASEIEKRREWQEAVYKELKEITENYYVEVVGERLIVLPGVAPPSWQDSRIRDAWTLGPLRN